MTFEEQNQAIQALDSVEVWQKTIAVAVDDDEYHGVSITGMVLSRLRELAEKNDLNKPAEAVRNILFNDDFAKMDDQYFDNMENILSIFADNIDKDLDKNIEIEKIFNNAQLIEKILTGGASLYNYIGLLLQLGRIGALHNKLTLKDFNYFFSDAKKTYPFDWVTLVIGFNLYNDITANEVIKHIVDNLKDDSIKLTMDDFDYYFLKWSKKNKSIDDDFKQDVRENYKFEPMPLKFDRQRASYRQLPPSAEKAA